MAFTIFATPPAEVLVDGGVLTNYGPDGLYYRDRAPVTSALYDGTLTSGQSVTLEGSQLLVSAGRSAVEIAAAAPVDATTGGGNTRTLKWDDDLEDYVPAAWRTDTSLPRIFVGPVDPAGLGSVVGPVKADSWDPDEEPAG